MVFYDEPVWKLKQFSRRQSRRLQAIASIPRSVAQKKKHKRFGSVCRPLCNQYIVPTHGCSFVTDKTTWAIRIYLKTVQRDISHDVALNCNSTLDTFTIFYRICIWMPSTFVAIVIVFAFRMHCSACAPFVFGTLCLVSVRRTPMLSHQTRGPDDVRYIFNGLISECVLHRQSSESHVNFVFFSAQTINKHRVWCIRYRSHRLHRACIVRANIEVFRCEFLVLG